MVANRRDRDVVRIAQSLRTLLASPPNSAAWASDALAAVAALVRARTSIIVIDGAPGSTTFGDARLAPMLRGARPETEMLPVVVMRRALVRAGGRSDVSAGADSLGVYGVGVIGRIGPDDQLAGIGASFAPRIAEDVATRRGLLLCAVWPGLASAARAVSVAPALTPFPLALIEALPVPAALYTAGGTLLGMNGELAALLRRDGDAEMLLKACSLAGMLEAPAGSRDGASTAMPDVRTAAGAYRVRRCSLPSGFADRGDRVLVLLSKTGFVMPDAEVLRHRFRLTSREYDVVALLCRGYSNACVADDLGITANTARHYTERVLLKLGTRTRAGILNAVMGDSSAVHRPVP